MGGWWCLGRRRRRREESDGRRQCQRCRPSARTLRRRPMRGAAKKKPAPRPPARPPIARKSQLWHVEARSLATGSGGQGRGCATKKTTNPQKRRPPPAAAAAPSRRLATLDELSPLPPRLSLSNTNEFHECTPTHANRDHHTSAPSSARGRKQQKQTHTGREAHQRERGSAPLLRPLFPRPSRPLSRPRFSRPIAAMVCNVRYPVYMVDFSVSGGV